MNLSLATFYDLHIIFSLFRLPMTKFFPQTKIYKKQHREKKQIFHGYETENYFSGMIVVFNLFQSEVMFVGKVLCTKMFRYYISILVLCNTKRLQWPL